MNITDPGGIRLRLPIFCLIIILSVCVFAPRVSADDLSTPDEVADFSSKSYDAVQSMRVLCTATAYHAAGTMNLTEHATAHIQFKRPDAIRVEGLQEYADFFTTRTNYSFVARSGDSALLIQGKWHKVRSAEVSIASVTGTALGAATTVPALLLHTKLGYPFIPGHYEKDMDTEVINDHKAYRIAIDLSKYSNTVFWIDQQTGFVLKEETRQAVKGRIIGQIVREYTYESIDGAVDDSVFAMPRLPAVRRSDPAPTAPPHQGS